MAENGEIGRLSVSRDAMRADLAEMELRLVTKIGSLIDMKADKSALDNISLRVAALELRSAGNTAVSGFVRFSLMALTGLLGAILAVIVNHFYR